MIRIIDKSHGIFIDIAHQIWIFQTVCKCIEIVEQKMKIDFSPLTTYKY